MGDDHRRRCRSFAALVLLALTLSLVPAAAASKRTVAGPKGIIDALNQARAANGLPALVDSRALAAAARAHAASMVRRGYFAANAVLVAAWIVRGGRRLRLAR
jgi:Cysteine-rich secretory protein family